MLIVTVSDGNTWANTYIDVEGHLDAHFVDPRDMSIVLKGCTTPEIGLTSFRNRLGVVRDGERSLLTGSAMFPSDHILQGLTSNHLRADCVGSRLSLYINGALANEAAAADWEAGDVGVIVGTYATPGVEILFDNFSIANP